MRFQNKEKDKELRRLRRLVNTVYANSPIKVIVLFYVKEGWDVNNVTTIVGLRYMYLIFCQNKLLKGLRRMYFGSEIKEELDVITLILLLTSSKNNN